jgi:hypothetical protein
MNVKPLTPDEIIKQYNNFTPSDKVVEAFNKLLMFKWDGNKACVSQKEFEDELKKNGIDLDKEFPKNSVKTWVNIDKVFQNTGWSIKATGDDDNKSWKFTKYYDRYDR